jgi:hypothetical protein
MAAKQLREFRGQIFWLKTPARRARRPENILKIRLPPSRERSCPSFAS